MRITEAGVQLFGSGVEVASLNGSRGAQESAAKRFTRLGNVSGQISLVTYYQFFGRRTGWDTAMVTPPMKETDPEDWDFRPVYCVLTKRKANRSLCPETHHLHEEGGVGPWPE